MRIAFPIVFVLAFAAICDVEAAVYKCPDGSFQDKPCEKGESKVVTKRNTVGKPRPPEDACAALGLEAAQIAQARADGAAAEKMFGDVDKEDLPYAKKLVRKRLIVDVYQKSGSPQEIGIIYEADCVKVREDSQKQKPPRQDASRENAVSPTRTADPAEAQMRAAEEKKRLCDGLTGQREGIMSQQRAGGSIATMEGLNRRRATIDKQISSAGCN